MLQIQKITNNALQQQTIVLPDGTSFAMTMYYRPMQYGWFIENLTYGNFILNGMRITNNPNLLYQYQNKIEFGLGCFTTGNREPTQQDDFSSGASALYILTKEECDAYRDYIMGGAIPA